MLLFGSETWMMTAAILQYLKVIHVGFLRQVAGMEVQRLGEDTWRKAGEDSLLQAAGSKLLWEYVNKRQATVAEWVDLRPIFEVCEK